VASFIKIKDTCDFVHYINPNLIVSIYLSRSAPFTGSTLAPTVPGLEPNEPYTVVNLVGTDPIYTKQDIEEIMAAAAIADEDANFDIRGYL